MKGLFRYQHGLAVLLGLTFGVVMFDRGAINFLAPFILKDLPLSNAQVGVAASVVAVSWAMSGLVVGRLSDRVGRRKPFLLGAVVLFSLCSIATGLVGGFVALVLVRLAMGLGEGPVPAMSTALNLGHSSDDRRGFNIGLFAFFTGLVGSTLAPLILVNWATNFGWRAAFFLAGVPGLAVAAVIALVVREAPRANAAVAVETPGSPLQILRIRNVWLCAVVASLLLASWLVAQVFLPLYLVRVRHLSPVDMGVVMTAYGVVGLVGALVLPTLSDHVGRKPVLAVFASSAVLIPMACAWWTGGVAGLALLCGVGALGSALPHVAIGMAPGESVRPADRGTALGLVMGVAEICGGFGGPSLAGIAADHVGLEITPVIAGACGLAAALLSLFLLESAPRRARAFAAAVQSA